MNWEKLRSLTRATLKNLNFESFCELGKTSKYCLRGQSFTTSAKTSKFLTHLQLVSVPTLDMMFEDFPQKR